MTQKDYELIAACLGGAYVLVDLEANIAGARTLNDIKQRLINELKLDNPQFDIDKFEAHIDLWFDKHQE